MKIKEIEHHNFKEIMIEQIGMFIHSCGVDDENYNIFCDYGTFVITVKFLEDYDKLVEKFRNIDSMNKRFKIRLVDEDYGITESGELSPEIIKRETLISDEWENLYSKMHKHKRM